LTDTGDNPAPATIYFQGRYSNGPLWVEYLSTQLGLAYNPANDHAQSGGETSDALAQAGNSPRRRIRPVRRSWCGPATTILFTILLKA
jgi:hypothetical protein